MLAARQVQKARETAELVLQKTAKHLKGNILLANILAAEKKLDAAIEQMNKAIALDPGRADSYINLAN